MRKTTPQPLSLFAMALACVAAQAAPYADLTVCSPRYKAVVVSESPALVNEVAEALRAQLRAVCPSFGAPLTVDVANRLLTESLGARHQALVAQGRVSIYLEAAR
ncbi:MAG: hypothetical protein AB1430_23620 [Pseudomonadota bacterium]